MLTFSYQVAEVNSAEEQEAVQRELDRRGYTRFGVRCLKAVQNVFGSKGFELMAGKRESKIAEHKFLIIKIT